MEAAREGRGRADGNLFIIKGGWGEWHRGGEK